MTTSQHARGCALSPYFEQSPQESWDDQQEEYCLRKNPEPVKSREEYGKNSMKDSPEKTKKGRIPEIIQRIILELIPEEFQKESFKNPWGNPGNNPQRILKESSKKSLERIPGGVPG